MDLSLAELVGKTDFDIHPPELAEKYRCDDRQVIETAQTLGTVEEHVRDVLESKRKLFRDVTVSEMAESEELNLDELSEIFGLDMRRLAERIRERYGLRLESTSAKAASRSD